MAEEVTRIAYGQVSQAKQSAQIQARLKVSQQIELKQSVAKSYALGETAEETGNPTQRFPSPPKLEERVRRTQHGSLDSSLSEEVNAIEEVEQIEALLQRFHALHEELTPDSLRTLISRCSSAESAEEVLEIVHDLYADPMLADEALAFLIEHHPEGPRAKLYQQAQRMHRKRFEREIRAGQNISSQARAFAAKGLADPKSLRELYRNVIDNPRDPTQLFEELAQRYSYDELREVIRFLFHSLHADARSEYPSIERSELIHLGAEARTLAAILATYHVFARGQKALFKLFLRYQIPLSDDQIRHLSFESQAKAFCQFVADRFPNIARLLQLLQTMGLSGNEIGQLLIIYQWQRAVMDTSPKLYRDMRHRDAIMQVLLDAAQGLEEQIEAEVTEQLRQEQAIKKLQRTQLQAQEEELAQGIVLDSTKTDEGLWDITLLVQSGKVFAEDRLQFGDVGVLATKMENLRGNAVRSTASGIPFVLRGIQQEVDPGATFEAKPPERPAPLNFEPPKPSKYSRTRSEQPDREVM